MKYLYYIRIGGNRGQYVIFTSQQKAKDYCNTHTTWSNTEILNNMKKLCKNQLEDFFRLHY